MNNTYKILLRKYDVVKKILDVIISCQNNEHLNVTYKVIENFNKTYGNDKELNELFNSSIEKLIKSNFYKQ